MAFEDGFNVTPKTVGKEAMANDEAFQVNAPTPSSDLKDVDCEKHGATRESNPVPDLKRQLKSRHLQMIAIGTDISSFFPPSPHAFRHPLKLIRLRKKKKKTLLTRIRWYNWYRSFHQ